MRIDHSKVERRKEDIRISQSDEHGIVNSRVALEHLASRLVGVTRVLASDFKRSVGEIELGNPSDKLRLSSRRRGHVAVVGADGQTWRIPSQVDELAGEREGLGAVASDGWAAAVAGDINVDAGLVSRDGGVAGVGGAVAGDFEGLGIVGGDAAGVGLVDGAEGGEVLPCEAGGVCRTFRDVLREVCPCPRLRNAGHEPDRHWVEAEHLAERHLLTGLGRDGLREKLCGFTAVEMAQESPDTGFTPASELLVEVDELADRAEGVVVSTLNRSTLPKHIGQKSSMTSLLDCHEGNVSAVFSSKARFEEILL